MIPRFLQGDVVVAGELARAVGRFLPSDVAGTVFVKLAGKRGWVPMSETFGVVPAGL